MRTLLKVVIISLLFLVSCEESYDEEIRYPETEVIANPAESGIDDETNQVNEEDDTNTDGKKKLTKPGRPYIVIVDE